MAEWYRFSTERISGETVNGYAGYTAPSVAYKGQFGEDDRGYLNCTRYPTRVVLPTQLVRRVQLRGKAGQPICMTWRPEGDRLLCGLGNGEVACYTKMTFECEDLKRVLAASGEITKIRGLTNGLTPSNSMGISPSGAGRSTGVPLLLLGDACGNIHVTTTNMAPVAFISIYTQKDAVFEISLSPNEREALIGVRTAHPTLLDLATEKSVAIFKGLGFGASALQWHPHQDLIAAGSKTHELQLWDPRDSRSSVLSSSHYHKGTIVGVEWHPTNDFLFASSSRDHLVHIWDIRMKAVDDWKPLYTCRLDTIPNSSQGQSANGASLSLAAAPYIESSLGNTGRSVSKGGGVSRSVGTPGTCPWCLSSPEAVKRPAHDVTHVYPTCMKWHPRDPSMFVIGDSAGTLSMWRNGECVTQVVHSFVDDVVAGWQPEITCLEWNPEGTILSTAVKGNIGGSVCFWMTPPRWSAINPQSALCGHPCHAN